jgi:Mg/Co/Ni transporter MgtE
VIRALALRQITHRDMPRVVLKEAGAGCMMGAVLGLAILAFSCSWSGISTKVGATVAIALPVRAGCCVVLCCVVWVGVGKCMFAHRFTPRPPYLIQPPKHKQNQTHPQLVSLWANGLGAFLTLLADRLKFDPAVTSVPAMTTIIDSTGLVIYFYIARWMLDIN